MLLEVSSAEAHPFGEPQTVRLAADGHRVTVLWSAAPDDLMALGGTVGALPSRREVTLDLDVDGQVTALEGSDADRLVRSPAVAEYLADRIRVRQAAGECRPEVSLESLVDEGARLVFTCPATVGTVTVEVATMTDVHDAYRTVAIGEGASPERALYTSEDRVTTWRFGDDHGTAPGGPVVVAAWGAGTVLLFVVVAVAIRRRGGVVG